MNYSSSVWLTFRAIQFSNRSSNQHSRRRGLFPFFFAIDFFQRRYVVLVLVLTIPCIQAEFGLDIPMNCEYIGYNPGTNIMSKVSYVFFKILFGGNIKNTSRQSNVSTGCSLYHI